MWEFLFCPIHGVFAPANWAFIAPAVAGVVAFARRWFKF